MLHIEGLQTSYGRSQVLFGIDFDVAEGEVVTLLGRNGMGKTTTVRSIMGLTQAHAGSITFHERQLRGLAPHRIARCGLGLVPEGRGIFVDLTVRENLTATARRAAKGETRWTAATVMELFPWMTERTNQLGASLSGGEQQMLAIGRALMTNPQLLILDEATEGLAPVIRQAIWKVLGALKAARQSILLIDKNLKEVIGLADRHYVIERGRVKWQGTSDQLRKQLSEVRALVGV
ncbi:MAG TPA: ABC transporter ATP-binding protein [Pseudolabrys sp.]|nr:ABC transporter ATP-binding protein [Pseudolabrys sp.]